MHGSGNDFILIDNRQGGISFGEAPVLAERICRRKFGVGADGLILIEDSSHADFRWRFFNADGSEAEMCGNGGRCAARFAYLSGIAPEKLSFHTLAGIIRARVKDARVKLQLPDLSDLLLDLSVEIYREKVQLHHINTGVPHTICFMPDLNSAPILDWGRRIRHHERFMPAGTNVNFVQVDNMHAIRIRTYERGVEDETLACGTGAVASAVISACKGLVESPVEVTTWGGEVLRVYFRLDGKNVADVFLEGGTEVVYTGRIDQSWLAAV